MASNMRKLLGRYTTVPLQLYRLQSGHATRLRDFEQQKKKQKTPGPFSFDLKLREDGLVHPALGDVFIGPNGASMRPAGPMFYEIASHFRGKNSLVITIPQGVVLPESLVILHEHSDHYSLQCTKPMSLQALEEEMTAFFATQKSESLEQFSNDHPASGFF